MVLLAATMCTPLLAISATDITQTFDGGATDLSNNFTQSSPATGTFTWVSNNGLSVTGGVSIDANSDQVWTTKEAYTTASDGVYTASAFMLSTNNNGYGALGFSIQSQDSNAGAYGAPAGAHVGAFFHGGGGGFLNNGPIDTAGNPTASDTPITWANGGILSPGTGGLPGGNWYLLQFTATAMGGNKYDLNLKIYNADANGTVGSLVSEHTMTDDLANPTRVGPAVTNANVGAASSIRVFFSAQGTRMSVLDNFRIQLAGGAVLVPSNSLAYSATSFAESIADDGSITTTSTVTLNGETFTGINGGNWSSIVSNVPAGLTAVLTRTSATTAVLSFTGNATNHSTAADINNLTVTFTDSYFTGGNAASIAGATTSNLVIDFIGGAGGSATSVPTLSEWAALVLSGLMALVASVTLRRRR